MLRIVGLCLLGSCFVFAGYLGADRLRQRVRQLEQCLRLLRLMGERMRYTSAPIQVLLEELNQLEGMERLPFLAACCQLLQSQTPFPAAWRESVKTAPGLLTQEEQGMLLALGEQLGATDLQGQIAALEGIQEQLQERLEQARGQRDNKSRLYQSLGAVSGIGCVLLLL